MTVLQHLFQAANRRYAIRANVRIGRDVHIGAGSVLWAPTSLEIGDDVYIGKRCTIEVDGTIGSGALIANNVGIVGRRDHDMKALGVPIRRAPWIGDPGSPTKTAVEVGRDVWIGFGAVVLAPVKIGRGAVIGAGAVVVRDVEPYSIVVGNPAAHHSWRFTPDERTIHEAKLDHGTP